MKKIAYLLFILVVACKKETTVDVISGPQSNTDKRSIGESANELLSASAYDSLVVEIQYMPGMRPQDATVNNLTNFLQTYLNKPAGISIRFKAVTSAGKPSLTTSDIATFTDQQRTAYTNDGTIAVYVLFADADFTTSGVVGIAYRNTAICLFEKTIQEKSGGVGQVSRVKVESGVLLHEVGHLLGLVNNGTAMVNTHEDPANKAHCTNSDCLMYFSIETSGLMNIFNNTIPSLDAACVADLKANGGK